MQRGRRPDAATVEDVDPQVAPLELIVVVQIARTEVLVGDAVGTVVEDAAAILLWVAVDTVLHVGTFHRRC